MHPETEQIRKVLRVAIRAQGFTSRAVERRMGYSTGYLSRLLTGRAELKVDHVCSIAQAIGVEPSAIFLAAFRTPSGPSSDLADQLHEMLPGSSMDSPAAAPAPSMEEDIRKLGELTQKIFRRLAGELSSRKEAG